MEYLRDAYWPIPALCVTAAGVGAYGLIRLDENLQREGFELAFTGGPESSRSLLSTIAASTVTLAALVFSITIVVLQLASSQFSPRALPAFLRDRRSQVTLGTFLGTFVFSLVALREVRGEDGVVGRFIPGVTISVAFALAVASVGVFVMYIHHIAQSIRVVNILERIADETRATIDRVRPGEGGAPSGREQGDVPSVPITTPDRVVGADRHGVVTHVDVDHLVDVASRHDAIVAVVPRVGDFMVAGAPLLRVWGGIGVDDELCKAIVIAKERTARQDIDHGLRQLVDIAERALSPGINDPSTASACIDQIHDLLRRLIERPDPSPWGRDDHGRVRAVVPVQRWEQHVALAVDELRHWGASSLQVRERLQTMVDDLMAVANEQQRQPLLARLPLWDGPLEPR